MSTYNSTIDALTSWTKLEEGNTVFEPTPLSKEIRAEMEAISLYLGSEAAAINLASTLMTLWTAMGNEDNPPSNDEMRDSLVQCSEVAWLIASTSAAENNVSYRLHFADLYEAQHGGRQS